MNEYDSNRIYDSTKKINYIKTENIYDSNCYVLNTCHIREKASEKVYHDIGRLKKKFRNKKKPIVIVTGCVAQAEGQILLEKEKYIDAIVGPQSYHQLNNIIVKLENDSKIFNSTEFEVIEKFDFLNQIKNLSSNVASFLTIQEGCDKFCKFCVVPYTRGSEFSRSIKELIDECKDLVNNGVRDITLLGQNVNAYSFKRYKLSDLIFEISKIKELKRIRYTTSHPIDFTKDLIEAHIGISKLMPLIHLPVQSGSNKILKSMNRNHTIEYYINLIEELKNKNSKIKFSSDFIIGYPGETDKDFNDTLKLLKRVQFINSYSFIYSPRPGTPAAKLKLTNSELAKERLNIFQNAADKIKLNYKKSLFESDSLVLFENKMRNENKYFGRDEYSNPVIVDSDKDLTGLIKEVKINNGNKNTLFGEINSKFGKRIFAA